MRKMFQICRRLTQPRIGITSLRVIAKFSTEQDLRVMRFISICLQLLGEKIVWRKMIIEMFCYFCCCFTNNSKSDC